MPAMWQLGGFGIRELGLCVWRELDRDDVFGLAAQLAYYFLLALFPLLLLATTIFGYFAQGEEFRRSILEQFEGVVPASAFQLVVGTLDQVSSRAGAAKISLGLLGTLWAASNGMAALSKGLNAAYDVTESRPWWKTRVLALGLTLAFVLFTMLSLALILAGSHIVRLLAGTAGLDSVAGRLLTLARWPVALLLVLLAIDLLYRFAPDLKAWRWHWVTPGAVVALLLWLAASLGFRTYLTFFNSYGATYGSLGAVIILMLWFYITGLAILIGAEVNAEIERAAAEAGDPDARHRGEKTPGEAGHGAERRFSAGGSGGGV